MVNIQQLLLVIVVITLLWLTFAFSYSNYVIQVIRFHNSADINFSQGIRIQNSDYNNQVFDSRNVMYEPELSKADIEAIETEGKYEPELSKADIEAIETEGKYEPELSKADIEVIETKSNYEPELSKSDIEVIETKGKYESELSKDEIEAKSYEEEFSIAESDANSTEKGDNDYEPTEEIVYEPKFISKAESEANTTDIEDNVYELELANTEVENNTVESANITTESGDSKLQIEDDNIYDEEVLTNEVKVNISGRGLEEMDAEYNAEDKPREEDLRTTETDVNINRKQDIKEDYKPVDSKNEDELAKSEIEETHYEVEASNPKIKDSHGIELSKSEIEQRKEWIRKAKFTLFLRKQRNKELLEYIQNNYDAASVEDTEIDLVDRYFHVKDRKVNPHDYRFVYTGQKVCNATQNPWLLIMVLSVANKISQRSAIRQTWGSVAQDQAWPKKKQYEGVKIMFIFGKTGNAKDDATLWREHAKYGDIVQANFIDSYNNLTTKVMMGIKWTTEYCRDVSFLLKVDDDSFIHVPNAIKTLRRTRVPPTGAVYGNAPRQPTVLREGKWALARTVYPFRTYPIYTNGQAYAISGNILKKIFTTGEYLPYVFIEDVFITGIVRTVIGASIIPLIGFPSAFMQSAKPCEFHNNIRVAATNISPHLMKGIWESLYSDSVEDCYKCLKESC